MSTQNYACGFDEVGRGAIAGPVVVASVIFYNYSNIPYGIKDSKIEGKESGEWKLVDGIDLIVHIFHPEKRKFYELEKIWSEFIPKEKIMIWK